MHNTMRPYPLQSLKQSYEDIEMMHAAATHDKGMEVCIRQQRERLVSAGDRGTERTAAADVVCLKYSLKRHLARACQHKLWCGHCKSTGNSAKTKKIHERSPGRQMTRTRSMPSK